jgi:hypothetical protein
LTFTVPITTISAVNHVSLQYLTAIENVVALEQGSQSCEEEAISFLKLNAIKIDYNSAL